MRKTRLIALLAAVALGTAGTAAGAAVIPAKITAKFHNRAIAFTPAGRKTNCEQTGKQYRCVFYLGSTADPDRVRGGTQISHATGCKYTVTHLGASLSAGRVELVNTCTAEWAKHISMP